MNAFICIVVRKFIHWHDCRSSSYWLKNRLIWAPKMIDSFIESPACIGRRIGLKKVAIYPPEILVLRIKLQNGINYSSISFRLDYLSVGGL